LVSLHPLGDAQVAELEIDVQRDAAQPFDLRIAANDSAGFELLGVRIDRLARILTCSVPDLPPDRAVWLYGAGQGGKQARRKLEMHGLRVAGFVDKFKTGTVDGIPIVDLQAARTIVGPGTTLIIASMFWEEIRAEIEAAGVATHLYSFYPFTGDVLYALN
jgi:hypothetical protein